MKTAVSQHLPMAVVVTALLGVVLVAPAAPIGAGPPDSDRAAAEASDSGAAPAGDAAADLPATVVEARGRARMLHETLHGVLQVVHRDFFQEDQSHTLPSQSLEDVFAALADHWDVEIRWLAVNAAAMNTDHQPRDAFEKRAVEVLASGQAEYESVETGRYRHAGTIQLASQCLKCHLPRRTSTEDRAAGLVITLPLQPPPLQRPPLQRPSGEPQP